MKILRGLLLASLLIFGTSASATSGKHEKAEQATFVLYGSSKNLGVERHPLCTAFVYEKAPDGYILMTAGHCFGPETPADATFSVAQGQLVDKPELQPVEVLNHIDDGVMDVAELHLKTNKKYPVLELDHTAAKIDDKVFYAGYPMMVSQVVYTGRVGSNPLQTAGPDGECDICKGRFLVQTGGGPGASGSPVISERTGKVVGVLEGHLFENGVVVVPAPAIEAHYNKVGHKQAEIKNVQSEEKPQ